MCKALSTIESSLLPITQSWTHFPQLLQQTILDQSSQKILEIGAGPNPVLSKAFVAKSQLDYTVSDIEEEELNKGKHSFKKRVVDFSNADFSAEQQYDLIFSKMVLEHIQNPEVFHQNVLQSLNSGGIAIHFFATLYGLPSVANLLLPEWLTSRILFYFQKRDPETEGKFPAYYRWCLGPVKKNIQRFERMGFDVVQYNGYLGHGYLSTTKYLWPIERTYSKWLYKLQNPYLTSNAIVVLRR